ncbi:MAG: OmpA family protein [Bacteroidia bacterium]|nr:OmpA family protein [Bacteroidia bacterium]
MKNILTMIFALLTVSAVGQGKIHKIIFFGAGQSTLTVSNKLQVDSIIESIKNMSYQITLKGYADTTSNENINLEISKKRVLNVSNYFMSKGIEMSKIKTDFYGEQNPIFSNSVNETRIKNRCVVIDVLIENKATIEKEREALSKPPKKFENDTVIRMIGGTEIEIEAETFFPKKISEIKFDVTEVYTVCDMLNNNVLTRAINGDCLTSAGMLFVRPTIAGVEVQPNKGKLVKIKIPTKGGALDKSMTLYGGVKNVDGTIVWKNLSPEVSYQEDGNQFYVFKVDTLSTFNLDKPMGIICKKDGHKVKIPGFRNVIITQTYPNERYLSIAEKNTKRRFTLDKVVKEKKPLITIVGFDKDDNPYLAQGPLIELKYSRWRDMYIVDKSYFKKIIRDYTKKMTPYDYLCNFSGYLTMTQ